MGAKKAFVFTIDAFISLTIAVIIIFAMLLLIHIPRIHYATYEQEYEIAGDTLRVLDTLRIGYITENPHWSKDAVANALGAEEKHSVLEQIVAYASQPGGLDPYRVDCSNPGTIATDFACDFLEMMIPKRYGYSLELNRFGAWETIAKREKAYRKLQAVSTRIVYGPAYTTISEEAYGTIDPFNPTSGADIEPRSLYVIEGESPYCYMRCRGYLGFGNAYKSSDGRIESQFLDPCTRDPCNPPSNPVYRKGNIIGPYVVRLVVYI
ncbi:MAG: hypothetical protein QXP42_00715 [Candidatus Micrarchaeia archaeon]